MSTPEATGIHTYRGTDAPMFEIGPKADPFTTEIVRRALNSAAVQMSRTMVRAAFSPPVYEGLDFAVVLYDRHVRLVGQAPTSPLFMGAMGFAITAAVDAIGGVENLFDGDVLIYNKPYGTGSHAQDCAIVMPIFDGNELVGYAANKSHYTDIGANSFYCSDTTDVFQEGVVLPGVKIVKGGVINDDVYRMLLANSRTPDTVAGDLRAQLSSCRIGAGEYLRVRARYGGEVFEAAIEMMIAHGEKRVRAKLEAIPDGLYHATCHMDDNGVDNLPIEFPLSVEVRGSDIIIDLSRVPDAQAGPTNCPLPSTVSGARVAIAMLGGGSGEENEIPNEGHFRPLTIVTRPGSMFHPVEPQPCFLYGWPIMSAIEGIYEALSGAADGIVPSGSAADICGVIVYGPRPDGEVVAIASPMPVGQGAHAKGDGTTAYVIALAQSSLTECEVQEAKIPVSFERWEFTTDSAGPGRFRGGLGWDYCYRLEQDMTIISVIERTKMPGWAQKGGRQGTPNRLLVEFPDGSTKEVGKITDMKLPRGSRVRVYCGGGGGYGLPEDRTVKMVRDDLLNGVISEEAARRFYPHAFDAGDERESSRR
jgi:N-methylhydantoinase B